MAESRSQDQHSPAEAVLLVHGIWCRSPVMWYLAWRLRRLGFRVYTFSYPSVSRDLSHNLEALADKTRSLPEPVLHMVAHSYGGLLLSRLLQQPCAPAVGRVVLLGAPLRGCGLAARLQGRKLLRRLPGRALAPLVAGVPGAALQQIAQRQQVGVVSGTRNRSLLGRLCGRPDTGDGLVSVQETQFPGARHIALPVSHAGMLFSARVAVCVAGFLRHGDFPAW